MTSGMTVRRRRRDTDGDPSTAEQRTLAEQAFEGIFNLILSGELPLGGVVNEANLAERFQISRGPVREAVQRLQGLRLITREPFMRAHVVSLSETDVRDIFQLRQAVEGIACRICADVLPGAELDDMLLRLERNRRDRENGGDTFDIHITIARACGNARIAQLLCEDLYYLLRIYRHKSGGEPGRRQQAFDEHWQILRALASRDGALAESLMRSHIDRAMHVLLGALGGQGQQA